MACVAGILSARPQLWTVWLFRLSDWYLTQQCSVLLTPVWTERLWPSHNTTHHGNFIFSHLESSLLQALAWVPIVTSVNDALWPWHINQINLLIPKLLWSQCFVAARESKLGHHCSFCYEIKPMESYHSRFLGQSFNKMYADGGRLKKKKPHQLIYWQWLFSWHSFSMLWFVTDK